MDYFQYDNFLSCIMYREISKIISMIDYNVCIIKGKPLSIIAFNDVKCRQSGDIDIKELNSIYLLSKNNNKKKLFKDIYY